VLAAAAQHRWPELPVICISSHPVKYQPLHCDPCDEAQCMLCIRLSNRVRVGGLAMRYFFLVLDGSITLNDNEGAILSNPEAAMQQAAVRATELAQDGESYNGHVVVRSTSTATRSAECRSLPRLRTTDGKTVLVLTTVKAVLEAWHVGGESLKL
jgi:hypothetical protein